MSDLRKCPRRLVFVDGEIWYGAKLRVRCLIHNISKDGAKIVLLNRAELPDDFEIRVRRSDMTVPGQIRWRKSNAIGFEFVGQSSGSVIPKLMRDLAGKSWGPRVTVSA